MWRKLSRSPATLAVLIAAQAVCAAFFVVDVIGDYAEARTWFHDWHLTVETLATVSLVAAILFEGRLMVDLSRRKRVLERNLRAARAAVHEVIEAHFEEWGLSPAERDVATFLVKGLSIAEIAGLRGSAEGTVKAHLNAIYRKSGVRNRGELLSVLIETMMGAEAEAPPLAADVAGRAGAAH